MSGELTGEKRKICLQMLEEYGITEIEATNILNGYGTSDYIGKYERIRNGIPLIAKSDRSNSVEEITVLEKYCEGSEQ